MSAVRAIWTWLGNQRTVRGLALASLVANVGIVVTGGAVRLTASGLGCPTVPSCTDDSLVPTREMGAHGIIEFGNRQLTFLVGAVAAVALIATLAQRPRRRPLVVLAALVLAVIPAQALIGALTVLTDLNPWVVGCHFLVSMAVIAAAYTFWRRTGEPDGPVRAAVPRPLRQLVWLLTAVAGTVLVAGTVVTGAGPHAGDRDAKRNGLDLESVSQLHVDLVFLLLGLTVAAWLALRAASAPRAAGTGSAPSAAGAELAPSAAGAGSAPRAAVRAAAVLLAVELGQGLIGFVQYFTDLPVLLVGAHMLGACLVWLAALDLLHRTRIRVPAQESVPDKIPLSENAPVGAFQS
jgi:cytochrome c oxidase assembly protein subunit 15